MNRLFILSAAASLMTGSAMAADLIIQEPVADIAVPPSFYATFFAGGSFATGDTSVTDGIGLTVETELDPGFIIGGAIGTTVYENLRGEVEFSYIQADVDTVAGVAIPDDIDATSTGFNVLANLWYDFENDTGFTPYLGAGLGYGTVEVSTDGLPGDINASGFLYQLGAGIKMDVADNIALDLGYRYRVMMDADTEVDGIVVPAGVDVTTDATNHIVQAGVSFSF